MKRESEVQIVVRIFLCSVWWLKNVKSWNVYVQWLNWDFIQWKSWV